MRRVGQLLLGAGGLAVVGLMTYILALDYGLGVGRVRPDLGPDASTVAVFYPERVLWQEFREGVRDCVRKGLAELVEESETTLCLRTPLTRRLVRFDWHDARGLRGTRDEVRELLVRKPPPLAVVGSGNSVLTERIAETLRQGAGATGAAPGGPLLLIPWATAERVGPPGGGGGSATLLGLHPGRAFRFCPNNRQQADRVVQALSHHDAAVAPCKAILVVDRQDPYSDDLAASFRRAILTARPSAVVAERDDADLLPGLRDASTQPGPAEAAFAASVWREAEANPPGTALWVVLPLQEAPTLRMLVALRSQAEGPSGPGDGPIRVLCGDGIGFSDLAPLAGRCPFPVWCASPSTIEATTRALADGRSPNTQVPAEVVTAVLLGVDADGDRPPTAEGLGAFLRRLRLGPADPASQGRSLAFGPSGERSGDDLGQVLMILPGRPEVYALADGGAGGDRWCRPVLLGPVPGALLP